MYYLYHIKGVKWGMTNDLKRRLYQQGYNLSDVCEIIEKQNIDEGADLEKELNIKYGYPWRDDQDYRNIYNAAMKALETEYQRNRYYFKKSECQRGGITTGNMKTHKQQRARRNNMKKLNIYKTCPYCNTTTRGAAYNRWHGENCKKKSTYHQ
jgi:hypothetical protein